MSVERKNYKFMTIFHTKLINYNVSTVNSGTINAKKKRKVFFHEYVFEMNFFPLNTVEIV